MIETANRTGCTPCPEGTYKDQAMTKCEKCPAHTIPSNSKTSCILYDVYNLNDEYAFNMKSFDSTSKNSESSKLLAEGTTLMKSGSFFGPIRSFHKSETFFISPKRSVPFDVTKYDYQTLEDSLAQGYIFGLFMEDFEETHKPKGKLPTFRQVQHRVLMNLGSKLNSVYRDNLDNEDAIVLQYTDGDLCGDGERYRTNIILRCNKNKDARSKIIYIEDSEEAEGNDGNMWMLLIILKH